MYFKKQRKLYTGGFTLVEMLVSISLFTVVLTMSVGTLLILIDANGRAQSMQLVMTNLTFALDSMTREIRTGFNWYCADGTYSIPDRADYADCSSGGDFISIVESGYQLSEQLAPAGCSTDESGTPCSGRVSYRHNPDVDGSGRGAIERRLGTDSPDEGGEWVPLTGAEIWIDEFRIVADGTTRLNPPSGVGGDTSQPTASIYIRGRAGVDSSGVVGISEREFDIQTTVTQRLLDI